MPVALLAGPAARRSDSGTFVDWQVSVPNYERVTLTISTPSGDVISREFKAGQSVAFHLKELSSIDDGSYIYQLTVAPRVPERVAKQLKVARAAGDDAAAREILRAAGIGEPAIESGAFRVAGGMIVTGGGEAQRPDRLAPNSAARPGTPLQPNDQVIPDDLIVQGSTCTGLDCVNNENFGFDTLRLKENNLRIHFDDTSTSAGFPANDWRLIANDSASGGSSKFSIEDSTSSKTPFTITAGASTNSIFVDSTGRVGFRTSTPVLDLHIATSNTPAIRLEQNNSGGFTAQTWDIGANEANFFVRDVTSGSRLPFRIRPGAPTSSVDISADGDTGVGTGSPEAKLHIFGGSTSDTFVGIGEDPDGSTGTQSALNFGLAGASFGRAAGFMNTRPDSNAAAPNPSLRFATANTQRMIIDNEGFIGIGTTVNPDAPIHYTNGGTQARLTTAGVWTDSSSRAAKENIVDLDAKAAFQALADLKPVTYNYKVLPTDGKVGFIAEDVPALVATPEREGLSALDIVAVVTKVVQEQQRTIEQLNERIAQLEREKSNQ